MTRVQKEGNQGLQTTHLPIPFLEQDGGSRANARIVGHSNLQCIPVVVPGREAVQYLEQQWGLELEFFNHVLPVELHEPISLDTAEGRGGRFLAEVSALFVQRTQQLLDDSLPNVILC